jgi:hypothetical protein
MLETPRAEAALLIQGACAEDLHQPLPPQKLVGVTRALPTCVAPKHKTRRAQVHNLIGGDPWLHLCRLSQLLPQDVQDLASEMLHPTPTRHMGTRLNPRRTTSIYIGGPASPLLVTPATRPPDEGECGADRGEATLNASFPESEVGGMLAEVQSRSSKHRVVVIFTSQTLSTH